MKMDLERTTWRIASNNPEILQSGTESLRRSSFSLKESTVIAFKAHVISLFNPLCKASTIRLLFSSEKATRGEKRNINKQMLVAGLGLQKKHLHHFHSTSRIPEMV
jgi:hypothetical protein